MSLDTYQIFCYVNLHCGQCFVTLASLQANKTWFFIIYLDLFWGLCLCLRYMRLECVINVTIIMPPYSDYPLRTLKCLTHSLMVSWMMMPGQSGIFTALCLLLNKAAVSPSLDDDVSLSTSSPFAFFCPLQDGFWHGSMPCGVAIPGEFAASEIAFIGWTKKNRKPWQKKCIFIHKSWGKK